MYKIMHGIDRIDPKDLFSFHEGYSTRGHSLKVYKRRCRLTTTAHSFSHRIVDRWNALPDHVVNSKSVNSFKNNLDKHWSNERYRMP